MDDHLKGTSQLASKFALKFNNPEWGRLVGLWHDLGKYAEEFQEYIKKNSGYEDGEIMGRTDHTSAAAILAKEMYPQQWTPISYCIAGHHAGLHNWLPDPGISGDLCSRLKKKELLEKIRGKIPTELQTIVNLERPCGKSLPAEQMHLWIRMLFSCLVDADFLDTERFMNPVSYHLRGKYDDIAELKWRFDEHMATILSNASVTEINVIRKKVLYDCTRSGLLEPGFFSITVPTGGGKTMSSMAWALTHALKFKKDRIVCAIPYTSIIAQTAQIYRTIFGDNNVVEHHSNLDDHIDSEQRKLATENWDAPVIVTTNVQLFESLYSNHTSHCRKLHNLANSIIILDEAQMLPPECLRPILSVLKGLTENFGVSVMFSTATQPALTGRIGGTSQCAFQEIGKESVREVVHEIHQLENKLNRVKIVLPKIPGETEDWPSIANELKQYEQVLCIVNTRKQCRDLFELMPDETLHLSRMMCTAHIMDCIKVIKLCLRENRPVRIISTQLIEAGVDIDFPVVYRAVAGLDSIAQAAGRCNREGKMNEIGKLGLFRVFFPPDGTPIGLIRKGADTFKEMITKVPVDALFGSRNFSNYFKLFYSKIDHFDKPDIRNLLWKDAHEMKFQFASASKRFRLIDDKGSKSILVGYNNGKDLLQLFKRKGPEAWLMRKLQQYTVTVNEHDFEEIRKAGLIIELHGCWIQEYEKLYNQQTGIQLHGKWLEEIHII